MVSNYRTMKKLIPKALGLYLNTLSHLTPKKAGTIGFNLFCRPFRSKLHKHHHDFLSSGKRFTLPHRHDTIQAYTWGHGPKKVLFLHGWQSHTFRWKNYIEALDKNEFTVYAFDAPGHGLSSGKFLHVPLYSEVVRSFIEHIGKVDSIVSHSIGGFTAIYTLHQHPHLTPEKLIVMAPPGEASDFFNFYTTTLSLSTKSVQLITHQFTEAVGKHPSYFSAKEFAKSLKASGLLIHDEEDDETSVQNSKDIHHSWKNSSLLITKGTGHNLRSKDVVRHVTGFLSQPQSILTSPLLVDTH